MPSRIRNKFLIGFFQSREHQGVMYRRSDERDGADGRRLNMYNPLAGYVLLGIGSGRLERIISIALLRTHRRMICHLPNIHHTLVQAFEVGS